MTINANFLEANNSVLQSAWKLQRTKLLFPPYELSTFYPFFKVFGEDLYITQNLR